MEQEQEQSPEQEPPEQEQEPPEQEPPEQEQEPPEQEPPEQSPEQEQEPPEQEQEPPEQEHSPKPEPQPPEQLQQIQRVHPHKPMENTDARIVRLALDMLPDGIRLDSGAREAIAGSAKDYIVSLFQTSSMCAVRNGKVAVLNKHLCEAAERMSENEHAFAAGYNTGWFDCQENVVGGKDQTLPLHPNKLPTMRKRIRNLHRIPEIERLGKRARSATKKIKTQEDEIVSLRKQLQEAQTKLVAATEAQALLLSAQNHMESELAAAQAQLEKVVNRARCAVCKDTSAVLVLSSCGHVEVCDTCSRTYWKNCVLCGVPFGFGPLA